MARGVLWALTWGPSTWAFPPLSPGSPQPATLTHLQGPCMHCSTCCCRSAAAPAWWVPSGLPVSPRATGSSIPDPTSQAPSPPSSLLTLLGLSSWSSSLLDTPTLFISLFSDRPCLGRNISSWTSGTWPGSAPLCPVPTIEPEPRQLLDQRLIHVKMRTETRRGGSAVCRGRTAGKPAGVHCPGGGLTSRSSKPCLPPRRKDPAACFPVLR